MEKKPFPIDGIRVSSLTVERCDPYFDDLAWGTLTLLSAGLELDHPGSDCETDLYFRRLFGRRGIFRPRTIYANPIGVVRSPRADQAFLRRARQLQHEWFGRLNAVLAGSTRARRQMALVDPIIKQLAFTGVLFIDNRHIFPDQWPDRGPSIQHGQRIKPGQRFGKLVVTESLPSGKLRCRCDCGTETVKRRNHVVSGRTKACGCTYAERQMQIQDRRSCRSWKFTGNLG